MEGERVLAVFTAFQGRPSTFAKAFLYDLIFTDRRLVGFARMRAGGSIADLVLYQAAQLDMRKHPRNYDAASLDRILAEGKLALDNFSIPYAGIEKATVGGLLQKDLFVKGAGRKVTVTVPKADLPAFTPLAREWLRAEVK